MKTIYIIGSPGAGKTTLASALRQDWQKTASVSKPVKHETYELDSGKTAISLGWDSPPFGGTDTLPYSAITDIQDWLPTVEADYLFGEGDRLAVSRFLDLAATRGEVFLFYLDTNPAVAADRRAYRADRFNLPQQNPSWVKGRQTKHLNLAQLYNATPIPGNLPIQQMCGLVWNTVDGQKQSGWE